MTKASPRIEEGVIKWYSGDAFRVGFEVIDEATGEPLSLSEIDTVIISFYNRQKLCVKRFEFKGERDCSNLECHIDNDITKQFPAGEYTYCIRYYNGAENTAKTVQAVGECEVERCH